MRKWILLLLLALILVVGVIVLVGVRPWSPKGAKIRTQKVDHGPLVSIVTCTGKVEARKKVDLSANVPGRDAFDARALPLGLPDCPFRNRLCAGGLR